MIRNFRLRRSKPLVFSRWSTSRPGVARGDEICLLKTRAPLNTLPGRTRPALNLRHTDDDVWALREGHRLCHVVHAANKDDSLQPNCGAKRIKCVADLKGKLTACREPVNER